MSVVVRSSCIFGVVLVMSASLQEVRACEEHWAPRRKTTFIVDLIRAVMVSVLPGARIVCGPICFILRSIIYHSLPTQRKRRFCCPSLLQGASMHSLTEVLLQGSQRDIAGFERHRGISFSPSETVAAHRGDWL